MPFAVALPIMAGLGAASGALSNTKGARTSTQEQKTTSSSTSKNSYANRAKTVLRPEQEDIFSSLAGITQQRMNDPAAFVEPLRQAARGQINKNYSPVEAMLREKYMKGGQAASGKFGKSARMAEMSRLSDLSGFDAGWQKVILDELDKGTGLGERLLQNVFETESSGTSEGNTSGTSSMSGTSVGPGSALAGGMSGGVESLMSLLMMNRLLGGGNKNIFTGK